jgi:hypothetical protein
MAERNPRKPKNISQKTWDENLEKEARELYERGLALSDIEERLGIPLVLLNDWKFMNQWEVLSSEVIDVSDVSEVVQSSDIAPVLTNNNISATNDDLVLSTVAANERLLSGYRLVQQTSQEALLNDNIKFKDKKQAADAFIDSLKGEVSVLGIDLSQQFLLDIAKIIKEEVTDVEILQRLGERLVSLGRLYNARITAQPPV